MAGAINVGVVTIGRFVLNVGGVNRDAACFLFRSSVNLVVGAGLTTKLMSAFQRNTGDNGILESLPTSTTS